jgi:type IV pilus assembly protein PilC
MVVVGIALLTVAILAGVFTAIYLGYSLPMRRAERARLFLDVLETGLQHGRTVEQTIQDLSRLRELSLGVRFHLLAAYVEKGYRFEEALDRVPGFLSPTLAAMFKVGFRLGDLRKVLPVCRRLLEDATSTTQGAESYLLMYQSFLLPIFPAVFVMLTVLVFPKLKAIISDVGGETPMLTRLVLGGGVEFLLPILVLMVLIYGLVFLYLAGPQAAVGLRRWIGGLGDRLVLALPWRRMRLQRDFSALLGILLDHGVPEAESVSLAAQATANPIWVERARRLTDALSRGEKLTTAIGHLDPTRELQWRLANAVHGRSGFAAALRGWHERLGAKAFQLEQAAAHGFTTGCILFQGIMVGLVVAAVFAFLTAILEQGILW